QAVAIADVEEEMLAEVPRQIDGLDQRHAQDVAVELHGLGHVLADQRQVVHPANLELGVVLRHLRTSQGGRQASSATSGAPSDGAQVPLSGASFASAEKASISKQ